LNRLMGIIVGLVLFLIIFSFIIYYHSDFDAQLVEQVDQGVPTSELIIQINAETKKMENNAKKRVENYYMDRNRWGNGSLASEKDYQSYVSNYECEMKYVSDYATLRKKFARREITKREFLDNIKPIKEFFKRFP
jgi:hypothetical protein